MPARLASPGTQLFFRVWAGIHVQFCERIASFQRVLQSLPVSIALFQPEIVGHPKNPAPKIVAGLATLQVLKQREEHLLNHFFAIVGVQAKRQQASEKAISELLEQADYFVFQTDRVTYLLGRLCCRD